MLRTLTRRAAQASANAPPKPSSAHTLTAPDPLLYDSKPRWWARWAWGLLALDIAFTTVGCDTIMNHWTQRVVERPRGGKNTDDAGPRADSADSAREAEWELRPFWQRLGLSVGQLFVGAAVGAAIMAFRDRTIWRMRLLPLLPSLPPSRPAPRPSPAHPTTGVPRVVTKRQQRWIELETGSGRKKKFMMKDCVLGPGRDETEMHMRIDGIRGQFVVGLTAAKVLGQGGLPEAEVKKRLLNAWGVKHSGGEGGGWISGPATSS